MLFLLSIFCHILLHALFIVDVHISTHLPSILALFVSHHAYI